MTYYSGVYSAIHRYLKDYIDALEPHKTNRYTYCYNNPVNKIDPLGLDADEEKASGVKAAANAEQAGDTKAQEAGKPGKTGTEQKGKTSEDTKKDQGAETKQPSSTSPVETTKPGDTKQEAPRPEPAPCPMPSPVDTRSPQQEAVGKNLEAKGGLPQRGLPQELHEALQPTGKGADIITWAAFPFLFVPATAPAAAVAFGTASYAGSGMKFVDAAANKDFGKATGALAEFGLSTIGGRVAGRLSGLESASFNWGSMRYQSEATGRFMSNAAGMTSNAIQYSAEAAVSIPFAVNEYKKPENP